MELNAIADGIKNVMDRLANLLQESLASENSCDLSDAIVEVITVGNKLSVEANTIIRKTRKREADLGSCLNQMKDVLQLQKAQILKLSSKQTSSKGTSTDTTQQACSVCELNEKINTGLRQDVMLLKCDADVLRRQLKQSKCLLQAQQVCITLVTNSTQDSMRS